MVLCEVFAPRSIESSLPDNVASDPRVSDDGIPTGQEDVDEVSFRGHLLSQFEVASGDVVFV